MEILNGYAQNFEERLYAAYGVKDGKINWPEDGNVDLKKLMYTPMGSEPVLMYNIKTKDSQFNNVVLTHGQKLELDAVVREIEKELIDGQRADTEIEVYTAYRRKVIDNV